MPRISEIDPAHAPEAIQKIIADHVADGHALTAEKRTLLHNAAAFNARDCLERREMRSATQGEKAALVQELRKEGHRLNDLLDAIRLSRSTYYYELSKTDKVKERNADLSSEIVAIFNENRKRYGVRRVHHELLNRGFQVNHKRVQRVMNQLELFGKRPKDIFGPGDERDTGESEPAPQAPKAEAVAGWEGGPPYRYIDVSRYQGLIDWAQVAAAGYKGAMLRAVSTNRKLSKRAHGLYIDTTFESNYRNAKAAGLDVGVYYYTNATSEAMADAELALLRQALRGKALTLPVAVDLESLNLVGMPYGDLSNLAAYHLEQIEKMGFFAQLYTYTSYANAHLDMARLSGRWDVWLADYTGKTPKVRFKYNAHQHTSKGSVPGINGPVDLDVTTVNYPKIIRKKGLTRLREGA